MNNFSVIIFIAQFDEISVMRSLAGMRVLFMPSRFRRQFRNVFPGTVVPDSLHPEAEMRERPRIGTQRHFKDRNEK